MLGGQSCVRKRMSLTLGLRDIGGGRYFSQDTLEKGFGPEVVATERGHVISSESRVKTEGSIRFTQPPTEERGLTLTSQKGAGHKKLLTWLGGCWEL